MRYTCSVPGCDVETSSRWGMWSHAKRHIREADSVLGRETDDYREVRLVLSGEVDAVGGPQVSVRRFSR